MKTTDWPLYRYRATVDRVVDGDTISVSLDLGDRTYRTRRIRIIGYDAPELFSGDRRDDGARARDALERIAPVGSRIYLATQLDHTSFDRLLADVYVPGHDEELHSVAELMISGGFALYHTS